MIAEVARPTGLTPIRAVSAGYTRRDRAAGPGRHKPHYLKPRGRRRALELQAVKEWRTRMMTEAANLKIKGRKRIEGLNAHLKVGDFVRQVVRGIAKVQTACIISALAAHNLRTAVCVRANTACAT
jgi:hypothetical protein